MRWPRLTRREPRDRTRPAAPRDAATWTQRAEPPSGAVHLGFTDGSEVELEGVDPRAVALKAVADVLMHRDQVAANSR
jgi:hypothetical protein